jgi:hypothetical protein
VVTIAPPPPINQPNPIIYDLPAGENLVRVFDPTHYGTQALTFRFYGPKHRFDHHRGGINNRGNDPERGIYYAALTLSGCLVECFGDTGIIEIQEQSICYVEISRHLKLLDLRDAGAMRSGANATLAKTADRSLSQEWSRYFYENENIYTSIDGLIYYNAHNDEEAIALYERAQNALICQPNQVMRLDNPSLRPAIQQVAIENNLIFVP